MARAIRLSLRDNGTPEEAVDAVLDAMREVPESGSAGKAGAAEQILRETNPDSLTPKAALELIYRLKAAMAEDRA